MMGKERRQNQMGKNKGNERKERENYEPSSSA